MVNVVVKEKMRKMLHLREDRAPGASAAAQRTGTRTPPAAARSYSPSQP